MLKILFKKTEFYGILQVTFDWLLKKLRFEFQLLSRQKPLDSDLNHQPQKK